MNPTPISTPASLLPFPIALFAGVVNVLAFAPFNLWPLQIGSLALLFFLVLRTPSVKHAALLGYAYGFGWSACGVHWLFISMHRYGGMPAWMAVIAVGLLALLLGVFAALAMGAGTWLRQRWPMTPALLMLLVFPALWALSEWLHGWVFTGFPWVATGFAHNNSPLSGFAPVVGVQGLGWLAALIAGCVTLPPAKKWPIGLALLIFGAGAGLKTIHWTEASGAPVTVRLLQANVPQEIKFENEQINATLSLYDDLIRGAGADLIATPETAIPVFMRQLPPDYLPLLAAFAQQSNSYLAIGIPISDSHDKYTNSALGLAPRTPPDGKPYRYDKHHLVPFGEFIPTGFRWFVDRMQIPLGDFTRGAAVQAPFAVKDQWVMPNICYEDLFGEEIAGQLRAQYFSDGPQATILLNMSNIAWFGDSIALPQHLQISQMRALETGRPMLRATNTGTTAVISPKGEVIAQLPPFTRGVLSARVQGYRGVTPYIVVGNALVVTLACMMLGIAWFLRRKN